MRSKPLRIAIVGANFAGLAAALRIPKSHRVTVLDPNPDFEFLPNIHELLSGVKRPQDLRLSKKALLNRRGHRLVTERVYDLNLASRWLITSSGDKLSYDICVVAIGGADQTQGVFGDNPSAMPFKTVSQCAAIGESLAEKASGNEPFSVVVVGGGLEAIEALGEILRRYRGLKRLQLHLVESGNRLLPGTSFVLDKQIRKYCERFGVAVHTNQRVSSIEPQRVLLDNGAILPGDLTICTGGIRPPDELYRWKLTSSQDRWAQVDETLLAVGRTDVFAIGDAVQFPKPLAKQAYHALDTGMHVAMNIERISKGKLPLPFRPAQKPMIISFGDLDTFLVSDRVVLAGRGLAALKEAIYQYNMTRLDPPSNTRSISGIFTRSRRLLPGWFERNELSFSHIAHNMGVRVLK